MRLSRKFLLYVILPVSVMGILMMLGTKNMFNEQFNRFVRGRIELRMLYELNPYTQNSKMKRLERAKRITAARIILTFVVAFGASIAVALVLSEIFQRKVSSVINEVSKAADKMAYGEKVEIQNSNFSIEIEKLTKSVTRLSQKLKSQSMARQAMTSSVYHEIMTPLGVIKMQLEALKDGVMLYNPALVEKMISNVDHISRVLKDLKNIEGGELKYSRERFDAGLECNEVCKIFTGVFESRGVRLKCSIQSTEITADRQRFKQVIFNLMSNAAKYTSPSGLVNVKLDSEGIEIFNTFEYEPPVPSDYGEGLNFVKNFCEFYGWNFFFEKVEKGIKARIVLHPLRRV